LLASTLALAVSSPALADTFVTLGGVQWNTTNSGGLSLSATQPGGNQPQNAPCVICGANQPNQPANFGYNDYSNAGNLTSITAFSDQGNGGRNTLADNVFGNGYQIGAGSPFLLFLLAHGDTANNLGFSIGLDINSTNVAQTLNSFYFIDFTSHTVLASYTGGTPGNVPDIANGTGFPDYTISGVGLNLSNVALGDTVGFVALMSGLNDGPDSFFVEPAVVPGPVVGAGFPGIIAACMGLWGLRRRRRDAVA
jgi:hypothetical protein